MRTPEIGDCVLLPNGEASFEARIIRVDAGRRQVVATMRVGELETPFHLTFEDVRRLDPAPAKVAPDPS